MHYIAHYSSPLGTLLLAAEETGLTGLWFEGQKHCPRALDSARREEDLPVFSDTRRWLDLYFSGIAPDFTPPLLLKGTDFQKEVWEILRAIPYGQIRSYGEIAKILAARRGLAHMSAQAVGGAVGRNPISILVPCHRVLGAKGSLTGYAGGLHRKRALLRLEGIAEPFFNGCGTAEK